MVKLSVYRIISLVGYLLLGVLAFTQTLPEFLFLSIVFFWIIKDITTAGISFDPLLVTQNDLTKANADYTNKTISTTYFLSFINRIYLFPLILTIYLVFLLIQQTQVRDLHLSTSFLLLNEQILLLLTILSGVALVYKQEKDAEYQHKKESKIAKIGYYVLSIILGLLTIYIVHQQIDSLGNIGLVISELSGLLVFLVGVLLMEEENDTDNTEII